MANPFYIKQLPLDAPFCNRRKEIEELCRLAESKNDVVIHSPRRFGKTSLVRRVQKELADRGGLTIYADFFGVGSIDDVAARLTEAVFRVTRKNEPLWKSALKFLTTFRPVLRPDTEGGVELTVESSSAGRTGLPLLNETMESLRKFIDNTGALVHIALDEFQEIVVLPEALKIEAALRTHIQQYKASHFFVGSRRRLLLGMFNERQRPFFQSAFDYPLQPLPKEELSEFLVKQFTDNGTTCTKEMASHLAELVDCYPYYAQKFAHHVYDLAGSEVTMAEIKMAMRSLIFSEATAFEYAIQGLAPQQRLLLRAIAKEPAKQIMATRYMRTHNLGSVNAVRNSLKQLELLDYIEKDPDNVWHVIDPVFTWWLGGRISDEAMGAV
jgi:hypothetical protein